MRNRVIRMAGLSSALAFTIFLCHASERLYAMSTWSLAFGHGPEPASFKQLIRFATYLDTPCSLDACINRLRQIDGAEQQWALEHGINEYSNAIVTWSDLEPYFKNGSRPWCPNGGVYRVGNVHKPPTCSIKGHALQ